jgi:ubiquinone/menaquinone biosynthesis C-methylase UbiE
MDAGCGRSAEVLRKFSSKADKLIGIDLEEQLEPLDGIEYVQSSIESIPLPDNCVDVVISRAVLEHIRNPFVVFREINRMLKAGGSFIMLAPNLFDYASILSLFIPNELHGRIVALTEGRHTEDVFPAYYKANTYSAISSLCKQTGFDIIDFQWLSQHPNYFECNSILYLYAACYERIISKFAMLRFLRGWLLVHLRKKSPLPIA